MLLFTNLFIVALITFCAIAGLDKIISVGIYLSIVVFSDILNHLATKITEDSRFVKWLHSQFNGKYGITSLIYKTKTVFYGLSFIVWIALFSEVICLASGHALITGDPMNSRIFTLCSFLFLYFYSVFAVRTIEGSQNSASQSGEIQNYRLLQYISVYQFVFSALYILMYYLGESNCYEYKLFSIHDISIFAFLAYLFCLLCERISDNVRIISAHLNGRKEAKYEIPFFVSLLAASSSFKQSLNKTVYVISGVDLAKSEMADYILKQLEPLTIKAVLIFWLFSSLVIVPPHQEAIFTRMGKISGNQSYRSGLHFKLPWPFEKVKFYEPKRVQTINVGFKPDPKSKHLIWAKSHAAENFSLLVGNGVEIVAVDCQVFYKISDLYKFVTKVQNPEVYIEDLAYQILTASTVSGTFDSILSQNRDELITDIKNKLQKQLNEAEIGVHIVEVVILAIHPPLEVAEAYEDVISSQIDKQMLILKANTESIHKLNMKKAFATNSINSSKGYAQKKVASAVGEASSFERRILGYNSDPELERFRLKLDNIQKMAKKKSLYVIDSSFMGKNDRLMLNLQN